VADRWDMAMSKKSSQRRRAGRAFDPVFFCMVGAMLLALGTSVALRMVVGGAGRAAASTAETDDGEKVTLPPVHRQVGPATRP
jgi:hypothetical protein